MSKYRYRRTTTAAPRDTDAAPVCQAGKRMIELDRVSYRWPDGGVVFNELSLDIDEGEKVVLLGANGCGKSTLLKFLNGLAFAAAGRYRYRGEEVTAARLKEKEFSRRFRSECTLLFQNPEAMLFNPTVREEIAYGPCRLGLADAEARVVHWAESLRLSHLLDTPPFLLSGGEKQKVALACLLVLESALLLLDEPSASLDPRSVGWLVDTLLADPARTVVVSTHNLSMAAEFGSRALILGEGGKLLFDGPVQAALADLALLEAANLAHRHRHRHGGVEHAHLHAHDWEPGG